MSDRGDLSPVAAAAIGLGGVAVVIGSMFVIRGSISPSIPALVLLIPIVLTSVVADWRVTIPVSIVAAVAYALAFLPPIGSMRVAVSEDLVLLLTFVVVSFVVGSLKGPRSRRAQELESELDERRAVLLRGVSHDLRNPLTTIRTISTELLDAPDQYDPGTRDRLLGRVVDESDRLERIVGNLLSASRVQAGALNPALAAESITSLIHRCVARLDRAGTHTIIIDAEPDLPDVSVDAVQIDQVLTNLIENALLHTPPGVTICAGARRVGEMVEVTIRDDGPGFSDKARDNLFRAFSTGVARSTGLGLGVCKAIVEAHGGTIAVCDQRAAEGASISFTLPVDPDLDRDVDRDVDREDRDHPAGRG